MERTSLLAQNVRYRFFRFYCQIQGAQGSTGKDFNLEAPCQSSMPCNALQGEPAAKSWAIPEPLLSLVKPTFPPHLQSTGISDLEALTTTM